MNLIKFILTMFAQGIIGIGVFILFVFLWGCIKSLINLRYKHIAQLDLDREEKEKYLQEYGYYIKKTQEHGFITSEEAKRTMELAKPKTWWQD